MDKTKFENIQCDKREGIATIVINRPEKLNALTKVMWTELGEAFRHAESDPEVKVIIITGAGERAFCVGDDISEMGQFDVAEAHAFAKMVMPKFLYIEKREKPVIAGVNGLALGGGFELALACDISIASENAAFGLPEARIGVFPPFALIRLPQVIGVKRAKELLLTCDTIDAKEAERIGLVNKVVRANQLMSSAKEMANKIMQIAPFSAILTKAAVNRNFGGEELEYAIEAVTLLLSTEDLKEGCDAFIHKRKPVFKGR